MVRTSSMDFEFEITGLRLKIKGDDVSGKVTDLQRQVQALMATITAMAQGGVSALPPGADDASSGKFLDAGQPTAEIQNGSRPSRSKGVGRKASSGGVRQRAEAIDFKHDAEKYGFPKQGWSTAQKAMWMLYMLSENGDINEFSASVIGATFNKHFKSFGTILAQNVLRDLGKEKGKSGAVNSDASQDPMKWYLLEAGKTMMSNLIAEGKKQPAE
jgi:hypothetical protein